MYEISKFMVGSKNLVKFNNTFLYSYKIWKKDQDTVYNKIDDDLKPSWISIQHNIYSSMHMPIIIFMLSLIFIINSDILKADKFMYLRFGVYFLVYLFLGAGLLFIIRLNGFYDRYADEKYIELSKRKK